MADKYLAFPRCPNCQMVQILDIDKGTMVKDYLTDHRHRVICCNCGIVLPGNTPTVPGSAPEDWKESEFANLVAIVEEFKIKENRWAEI